MNDFEEALEHFINAEKLWEKVKLDNYENWIEDAQFRLFIYKTICKIKLNMNDTRDEVDLINNKLQLFAGDKDNKIDYLLLFEFYTLLEDKVNAKRFLEIAYNNIIDESKKLTSDDSRKLFLQNQAHNRKVVEEWEKVK